MRAANHHGRGTAKHAGRHFDVTRAPHIDPDKTAWNRYWTWNGTANLEAAELDYYRDVFSDSLDAVNAKYLARRQKGRVRTIEDWYRTKPPEGSLLYIGDKTNRGEVSPDALGVCAEEYRQWQADFAKAHGMFYFPLSSALHVDEKGAYHVEDRGVYQYWDGVAWCPGQDKALEAAGIPLPDPTKPRSRTNNRKMTWDAMRREKWLDIVEAHGFTVEREPEEERPHMGLKAWQAWRDAMAEVEADRDLAAQELEVARQEAARMLQEAQEARQEAQAEREAQRAGKRRIEALEADVKVDRAEAQVDREKAARTLQEAQEARSEAQAEREAARVSRVAQTAISDAIGMGVLRRRKRESEAQAEREAELARREAELAAREQDVTDRERDLDVVGKAMLQHQREARQQRQEKRSKERAQDGESLLGVLDRGPEGRIRQAGPEGRR